MKTPIIAIAITAILSITNISTIFGSENSKLYRAEETNNAGQATTVTISEGSNDKITSPKKQYRFKYYSNGATAEKEMYTWNQDVQMWIANQKYTYQYNSDNHLVTTGYTKWNDKDGQWNSNIEYIVYLQSIDGDLLTINYLNTNRDKINLTAKN